MLTLRPSMAAQWGPGGCPASVRLQALYPETDSQARNEGIAADFYVSEFLQGRTVTVGAVAPNGFTVDAEMIECAGDLLADVMMTQASCSPEARLYVQHDITGHGMIHPQNEGRPDIVLIDYPKHSVFIWDYKYGHRFVDEYENWELLNYLAMVVEGLELTESEFKGWRVRLTIAQPRHYRSAGLRHWDTIGHKVWPYFARLARAAEEAADPDSPTRTGSHCRDCRALGCEARLEAAEQAVEVSRNAQIFDFTPEIAGRQYRMLEIAKEHLEALMSSMEAYLVPTIKRGQPVKDYELKQSWGNLTWTIPDTDVITLGAALGKNFAKPVAAITPTQAKKLGIDESVIALYSTRKAGEFKLSRIDPRTAQRKFDNG